MLNIGPQELLIVLVLALIVVGPTKLPELARQVGKGLREFRKVQDDVKGMMKFDLDDTPARPAPGSPSPSTPRAAGPHRTARPAPATGISPPVASSGAEPGAHTDGGPDPAAP
jgi:sec-independent protein translocase protein TatB